MNHGQGLIAALALVFASAQTLASAQSADRVGAYVVIEINRQQLRHQQLDALLDSMTDALSEGSVIYDRATIEGGTAHVRLNEPSDVPRALEMLSLANPDGVYSDAPEGVLEGRIPDRQLNLLAERAAQQTRHVIASRISDLGLRASVQVVDGARVRVQTGEPTLPVSLRNMLVQQGRFTFHLVRDSRADFDASGETPAGTMIAPPYFVGDQAELVEQNAVFTGERLVRANPTTDLQTGEFVLSFRFDAEGTGLFCEITRKHIGQRFGILFDGRVLSAPRINEQICGGTGQISGGFTAESANELAVLLMSGALPAPIRIVEEGVAPTHP